MAKCNNKESTIRVNLRSHSQSTPISKTIQITISRKSPTTVETGTPRSQRSTTKATNLTLPTCFEPYQIGDKVWLEGRNLTTTHPSSKLAPRRYGPFSITRVVSRTSYQLKLPLQWKIHDIFHATLLTPYKETALNGKSYQEPAPDLIDGQPEWEVESILKV